MPASQEQKVDFLLKKIGYSASKTGIAEDESTISTGSNTAKKPFEEGIPSPLIIPQSSLWADSGYIPTTPPGSDTAYVKGYRTATALRMTRDATVGTNTRSYIAYTTYNNTSSARLTNWIDTQFGASYIIKVYKGDPNSGGVELQQAGANAGTDGWFFDYSSGILNFNGQNLPSGISATNIYIVGYRYIGATGARPPAGIGTFEHLYVAGVSTFMGSIDANSNLDVAGISTFNNLIDANGRIVGIQTNSVIPFYYANVSDFPSSATYHGAFAHAHNTGKAYFAHAGWKEIVSKEANGTIGVGTERYNIGPIDATSLKVTGITTLGSIGISTGRITGPAITYIDPATVGAAGTVVILGNLQVDGTQTTVNSATMTVTDKNILLAKGAANDAAANTGGITVSSGQGDKTWQWLDGNDSWSSSEHIRVADDKVYGWVDDTNTYIGRPAADTIAFTHGGSEKVRIDSSGRVLIGTTTEGRVEADDLTIATSGSTGITLRSGAGNAGNIMFSDGTSGDDEFRGSIQYHHLFDEFRFFTNAVKRFTIASDGDVGINTESPRAKLDVDGTLNVTGVSTFFAPIKIDYNNTDRGLFPIIVDTTYSAGSGIAHTTLFKHGNGHRDIEFQNTFAGNWNVHSHHRLLWTAPNESDTTPQVASIQPVAGNAGNLQRVYIKATDNSTGLQNAFDTGADGTRIWVSGSPVVDANANGIGIAKKFYRWVQGSAAGTNFGFPANNQWDLHLNGTRKILAHDNYVRFENLSAGVDINTDLDVDGHTELDDVNVSGITTTKNFSVGTTGQTLVGITTILDEDNFASNSATALATQQSIKAYVDTSSPSGSNLAVSADSGSNESINLNTEVLDIEGTANEIETATGTNKVVIGLPNDVSITNLTLGGTVSAGSTTGTDGYYLKTTGIGVTWAAFPSSRTGLTTTATAGQTTFNFSYNIGFVDVFVNGVKLPSSEFTASNGSTIVLDDAAFANDTLEFISLNTLPVTSSGGASNLDGLADVTISGTPVIGETLQHNGSQFVNDYTVSSTTTSTSQTAILNLPVATYRSVEYTIQITEGTKYHVTKVLAIHDGTNVTFNEYGTLTTSTSLSTFALDVNSGNMRLLATPASTNSTVFKVKFTGIKV